MFIFKWRFAYRSRRGCLSSLMLIVAAGRVLPKTNAYVISKQMKAFGWSLSAHIALCAGIGALMANKG